MSPTRRLILIWMALIALTLISIGTRTNSQIGPVPMYGFVIAAALLKVRFVILDFMEVRHAPWALRLLLEAWIFCLCAVLIGVFS